AAERGAGERRLEVAERPAERADARVADLEADGGVHRIGAPRAGRSDAFDNSGHCAYCLLEQMVYTCDVKQYSGGSLSSQVLSAQLNGTHPAWVRFLRAHAAVTRELSVRLEAEHGLTLSDYEVLVQLYFAPERAMRRIDIARAVLLTASGITRLLDGLERCGLVEKKACATDAR